MRQPRWHVSLVLAAVVVPALAGCGTTGPAGADRGTVGAAVPATAAALDEYRIGPADVLHITVWRNEQLSGEVPVRPDGKISLPLLNDIQAAGLTAVELRDEIARRLKEYVTAPAVTVAVKEINSLKVNVLGQVQKPGVIEVKRRVSVLEAIALAGGLTPFAAPNRMVVLRKGPDGRLMRIGIRYNDLLAGDDRQNILLQRDDTIMVPQSLF
ncbi:MAG TPA: polysaccharide biosynthesis/export family protein [Thermodesulfobacteriota bacterium]